MPNETDFKALLETVYEKGGNPQYVVVPGIGELYWPSLSDVEKAYAQGWLHGAQYERNHARPH